MTIVVTGATGNVGNAALHFLAARNVDVVAATRGGHDIDGVPGRRLDFREPATFRGAIKDARAIVLVRPPEIDDVESTLIPFIDAAREHGVEHVAFLSMRGAQRNPLLPHSRIEKHLVDHGPGWTFLRAGFFAQNVTDIWLPDIVEDNRLYLPCGDARIAFLDARDLGAAAALALLERRRGEAWELTGPMAHSLDDVADMLSRACERSIRYERTNPIAFLLHLRRRRGLPWAEAAVLTALHAALRDDEGEDGAATVTHTLERVLGHAPRSMSAFLEEHAAMFSQGG